MKNILTLFIALLFLTACQSTPSSAVTTTRTLNTPTASATPNQVSATTTPSINLTPTTPIQLKVSSEDLKGVEVHFWHPWMGETTTQFQTIIDEFNRTNIWGIHAVMETPGSPAQLYGKMQNAMQANNLPQVVAAPTEQLANWQKQGQIVINLDDYIEDPQWGLSAEDIADFPANVWARDEVNGHRLGIPAQIDPRVIIYNQTWAQELGFANPPTTPQEFMDQSCAAFKANMRDQDGANNGTGGWIINTDPLALTSWMPAFGISDLTPIGDASSMFNRSEIRSLFLYLRTMMDQNCAWNSRNPTPYEYFAKRMALVYTGTLQDVIAQQRTMTRLESKDDWVVIPFPGVKDKSTAIANGTSYAVLAASPKEQLAGWLLVRWLSLPRNQAILVQDEASWPVSKKAVDLLTDYRSNHPQWDASLAFLSQATLPPRSGDWLVTRNIFQDAAWQTFQSNVKASQIPDILTQLDQTIPEVLKNTPQ